MFKKIALVVVGLIVAGMGLLMYLASTKPDEFRVERSIVIKAPPEKIFAVIADFHRSPEWSPWEKLDPNLRRAFAGPTTGKGARYEWSGNDAVGEGSQEVVEFQPPTREVLALHFARPMTGESTVEFVLQPEGDATRFTWSMHGPSTFQEKMFQVFMNCHDMVAKQLDEGLANLKALCEKA